MTKITANEAQMTRDIYAAGEKIKAIRALRGYGGTFIDPAGNKRGNIGLKEAKEFVENGCISGTHGIIITGRAPSDILSDIVKQSKVIAQLYTELEALTEE